MNLLVDQIYQFLVDVLRGHRGEKSALIEFKEATGEISSMNMLRTPILEDSSLWCLP